MPFLRFTTLIVALLVLTACTQPTPEANTAAETPAPADVADAGDAASDGL